VVASNFGRLKRTDHYLMIASLFRSSGALSRRRREGKPPARGFLAPGDGGPPSPPPSAAAEMGAPPRRWCSIAARLMASAVMAERETVKNIFQIGKYNKTESKFAKRQKWMRSMESHLVDDGAVRQCKHLAFRRFDPTNPHRKLARSGNCDSVTAQIICAR